MMIMSESSSVREGCIAFGGVLVEKGDVLERIGNGPISVLDLKRYFSPLAEGCVDDYVDTIVRGFVEAGYVDIRNGLIVLNPEYR